jgi:hypothetical protein
MYVFCMRLENTQSKGAMCLDLPAFCLMHPHAKLAYSNDVFSRLPLYTARGNNGLGSTMHEGSIENEHEEAGTCLTALLEVT